MVGTGSFAPSIVTSPLALYHTNALWYIATPTNLFADSSLAPYNSEDFSPTPQRHSNISAPPIKRQAEQLDTSAQQLAVTRKAVSRLAAKGDSPTSPEYDSLGRPLDILRDLEEEEGATGTSPVIYYPPKKSPV